MSRCSTRPRTVADEQVEAVITSTLETTSSARGLHRPGLPAARRAVLRPVLGGVQQRERGDDRVYVGELLLEVQLVGDGHVAQERA